jgi:hypothetical protein
MPLFGPPDGVAAELVTQGRQHPGPKGFFLSGAEPLL